MARIFGYGLTVPVGYLTDVPTSFRIYAETIEEDILNNRFKVRVSVYMGDEGNSGVKIYATCSTSLGDVGTISYGGGAVYYGKNSLVMYKDFWVSADSSFTISFTGRIGYDDSSYNRSMSGTAYTPHINRGLVYIDNGSSLQAYQCYRDNGSSWDLLLPYRDNGSSWDLLS